MIQQSKKCLFNFCEISFTSFGWIARRFSFCATNKSNPSLTFAPKTNLSLVHEFRPFYIWLFVNRLASCLFGPCKIWSLSLSLLSLSFSLLLPRPLFIFLFLFFTLFLPNTFLKDRICHKFAFPIFPGQHWNFSLRRMGLDLRRRVRRFRGPGHLQATRISRIKTFHLLFAIRIRKCKNLDGQPLLLRNREKDYRMQVLITPRINDVILKKWRHT